MSYYRTCPRCGAHLDPGEICTDCREKERAPASAANTGRGIVENVLTDVISASIIANERRQNKMRILNKDQADVLFRRETTH